MVKFPKHTRFILQTCFLVSFHAGIIHAQSLELPDESDIYTRHIVVDIGDRFQFVNRNMRIAGDLGAFDNKVRTGEHPSFQLSYDEAQYGRRIFWSRHPVTVLPYTGYVVRFKTRSNALTGRGPTVELVIYDETRDTEKESYMYVIRKGKTGKWTDHELRFTTENKARFARLMINAEAGGACRMWIDDVIMEQISPPMAMKPEPVNVLQLSDIDLADKRVRKKTEIRELPSSRDYYHVRLNLEWVAFEGMAGFTLYWLASDDPEDVIAEDQCVISPVKGIQPSWNGIQVRWWKKTAKFSRVSWKLDRLSSRDGDGGSGFADYRVDRPENARYLLWAVDTPDVDKGRMVLAGLHISGEY
jgi:hypothetical protein